MILLPAHSVLAAESELTYHTFSLGNDIIAPGQYSEYHIILNNSAAHSRDYLLRLEPIGPVDIPLQVKLKQGEQYLIGTADSWVDIGSGTDVHGVINGNTSADLTLIWEWQYYIDSRQDQTDSSYGKAGCESIGFLLDVKISEDAYSIHRNTSAIPVLGDDNMILKWGLAAIAALGIGTATARRRGGWQ